MALPTPSTVGPYTVGRALGHGGAASVYASTNASGRPVAIKLMTGVAGDEVAMSRYRREIDALSRLSHDNVLPLWDSGLDPQLGPYLVTPLLEGRPVRELGATGASPELAILLGAPLTEGLCAVHAAGLVHRDLKPENLMMTTVSGQARLVIIDFGLAVHPAHSRHTREGAVAGSVPYMSPEQIAGEEVTTASDIWSVGVMLYEWCTGARPFARPRQHEEVAAILAGHVAPLDDVDRRASSELRELVARCLSVDPAARPSADVVGHQLSTQLDWVAPPMAAAELTAAARDPAGFRRAVAPVVVARLQQKASSMAASDPFAAMRVIDRGLAYDADNADLQALATELISGGRLAAPPAAGPPSAAPTPVAASPRRGWLAGLVLLLTAGLAGVIGFAIAGSGGSSGSGGFTLDHTVPESVLQAVFEAAKNDDTSELAGLCDPNNENDGDTRDICQMTTSSPRWAEFKSVFASGAVNGPARIGGRGAEVDFFFAGGKRETMNLVRRGQRYYLSSF